MLKNDVKIIREMRILREVPPPSTPIKINVPIKINRKLI